MPDKQQMTLSYLLKTPSKNGHLNLIDIDSNEDKQYSAL